MAGAGSRLGDAAGALPKPLIPLNGKPLMSYTLDTFTAVGVTTLHIVVGMNGERLAAEARRMMPRGMELNVITNSEWRKQNGVSVLAAAAHVNAPFFLAMGDHIFERAIIDALIRRSHPACLNLAVDKKISSIFDLDDAMKVRTRDGRITEIGKELRVYDAIDTGVFLCPTTIFEYLRRAQHNGDCSLADGVRLMADEGNAIAIDIGDAWWHDIDTPEMLERAQQESRRVAGA